MDKGKPQAGGRRQETGKKVAETGGIDKTGKKWAKRKSSDPLIRFNIYGRQPLLEALRSSAKVEQVWLAKDLQGPSVKQIKTLLTQDNILTEWLQKDAIQKIVGPVVHQGVAAQVQIRLVENESAFTQILEEKENPLVLILDQVQDPHNFGAILRTAEVSGVDIVVMPLKGSAEINATVAKTSAGGLFYVPIYRCPNLLETFEALKSLNIQIVATLPHAGLSMYQADFKKATAIIVGNEGQGVRKNIVPFADHSIYIPQKGLLNSLNASVSTAVVLYEALRQRQN